jgi:hypothetical protein
MPRTRELGPEAIVFWVTAGSGHALPRRARGFLVTAEPTVGRTVAFEVAGCRAHPLASAGALSAGERPAA